MSGCEARIEITDAELGWLTCNFPPQQAAGLSCAHESPTHMVQGVWSSRSTTDRRAESVRRWAALFDGALTMQHTATPQDARC